MENFCIECCINQCICYRDKKPDLSEVFTFKIKDF